MASSSEATSKKGTESINKMIPFSGSETTKGGVTPREFFYESGSLCSRERFQEGDDGRQSQGRVGRQREVDRRGDGYSQKQDADVKQFLILSCSGNALNIIASHETAFGMYQALKNRYDSKRQRTL